MLEYFPLAKFCALAMLARLLLAIVEQIVPGCSKLPRINKSWACWSRFPDEILSYFCFIFLVIFNSKYWVVQKILSILINVLK